MSKRGAAAVYYRKGEDSQPDRHMLTRPDRRSALRVSLVTNQIPPTSLPHVPDSSERHPIAQKNGYFPRYVRPNGHFVSLHHVFHLVYNHQKLTEAPDALPST